MFLVIFLEHISDTSQVLGHFPGALIGRESLPFDSVEDRSSDYFLVEDALDLVKDFLFSWHYFLNDNMLY